MPFEANVIRLHVAQPAQQAASGRPPLALARVRNEIAGHLRQVLQALFESADDWLFELADHSADRNEQQALFEAMRDLRLNRAEIERSFQQRVFDAFASIGPDDAATPILRRLFAAQPLRCEQPRDPRERAALDDIAARLGHLAAASLGQLTQRIVALTGKAITQPRNPFGPHALCGYFLDACQSLGVDIRVRLVMLRLFERYAVADLDRLYRQSNRTLAAAGVLPTLQVVAEQEAGGWQMHSALASLEHPACGVFAALKTLWLRRQRAGHTPYACPARIGSGSLAKPDETAHALVAMLFEALADDHNLPAALHALLPRMLPAFARMAALDETLFEQRSHPARRLLDEMTDAAIGWNAHDDLQADPAYRAIEQITRRLAHAEVADATPFCESLSCLRAVCTQERRRSDVLMQRTLDAEQNRCRASAACEAVETALDGRLFGQVLPEAVTRLLCDGWSKVLLQTHLRHGPRSAQWRAALQTMDQLLWSLSFSDPEQSRTRLLEVLPTLLEALRRGLASVAFDPFATADFFAQLEAIHLQAAALATESSAVRRSPVSERIRLGEPQACKPTEGAPLLPPALHEHLRPGCWVEFREDHQHRLRCRLAAAIPPHGRYLFVNRSGIKVLEKSASALAIDWQRGAVALLEDGSAFERAFDALVAELQHGGETIKR